MTLTKPKIVERWQKKNKFGRPGIPLKATRVAIHYTGQADVPGKNTVSYFNNVVANGYKVNGRYIYASAHFVIDLDGTIYQLIPINEMSYCTNSANSYAISVEVATTGKDNHYTDATYRAMAHLCAWLCKQIGIKPSRGIITHTDVVGKAYKLCPIYMVKNPKKLAQFKTDCDYLYDGKITPSGIVNCTDGKGHVTKLPTNESTNTNTNHTTTPLENTYLRVLVDNLNIHNKPDFESSSVCGQVNKGDVYTVVGRVIRKGSTNMYKLKSGVYITASTKYVETFTR